MVDFISFTVLSLFALTLALIYGPRLFGRGGATLLVGAVFARMIGSTARLEVIHRYYNGFGDARAYFFYGEHYASRIVDFDFSFMATDHTNWWGTQFVRMLTGLIVVMVGPSIRGAMLMYGLLSLLGLVFFTLAFREATRNDPREYIKWLWFWPSLWFWPASIGKDALILLGVGMITYGYVGLRGKPRFGLLLCGLALVACIRPHVAAVIGAAIAIAEWLSGDLLRGAGALARGGIAITLAVTTVYIGMSQLGLADADLLGIEEQFEYRSLKTQIGGSQIAQTRGLLTIPMAFVNVLLRPVPWEAHNPFALVAALEVWGFWLLLFLRRRGLGQAFRGWRQNRLLRFALPMIILITLLFGVAFNNLGIIARQRVIVLPFLLIAMSMATPVRAPRVRTQYQRRQIWSPQQSRSL